MTMESIAVKSELLCRHAITKWVVTEITQPCIHTCNGLFICQLYLLPELLEEMDSNEDTLSQLIIVI
jgi:hypothetical protein